MRKIFHLFLLFPLFCSINVSAQASPDSIFTVTGVEVDITAKNAATAQKQAFFKAQNLAFAQLIERLLTNEEREYFTYPETSTISTLVKDYEITQEKASRVRYIGTYTFRFAKDPVRQLIAGQGLRYTDVGSKPVLALPFYHQGAETLLWDDRNPWLTAWARSDSFQGLVPVTIPIGDLQDAADISAENAMSYDPEKLKSMVNRYQTGEAIIMVAIPQWTNVAPQNEGNAVPTYVDVILYRTDRGMPELSKSMQFRANKDDTLESLLDRAVQKTKEALQDEWKSRTMIDPTQGNRLKVRVRFKSIQEWVETQNALNRVQGLNDITLLSLTPEQASLELVFQGTEQRLRLALSQADMTLTTPSLQFGSPYTPTNPYGTGYGNYSMTSPLIYDLYLNKYKKTY